ncbi:hypothetical protein COU54_04190 [Candidatus Pacearchaeota archaeon CG10_big_fil_rev_8_21_14_0_10_31_24]|nr:MAG: hypothetical protein COU54_04190 [Candidatus Pacearchaeota archaeon CG10_big_fil_rev_8_21_14_0_10_31_24]
MDSIIQERGIQDPTDVYGIVGSYTLNPDLQEVRLEFRKIKSEQVDRSLIVSAKYNGNIPMPKGGLENHFSISFFNRFSAEYSLGGFQEHRCVSDGTRYSRPVIYIANFLTRAVSNLFFEVTKGKTD